MPTKTSHRKLELQSKITQIMVIIKKEVFPNFFIGDEYEPIIQGIVNLSPESFYKRSVVKRDEINGQIKSFIDKGAKILDVGARSTAPGVVPITQEEEIERLKPFLESLVNTINNKTIISIDTQYSKIGEYCINFCQKHGFNVIINDVSGLKTDPKMMDMVIDNDVPLILMASSQRPGDIVSVNSILESLFESVLNLERRNYDLNKLIIDPGIGKWIPEKTYEYDLSIIDNLQRFRVFGQPILVGISRKSFITGVLGPRKPDDRYNGTLAATTIAVYNGAHIIRTHDITDELFEMIRMGRAIRKKPLYIEKNGLKGGLIKCIKDPIEARFYQRRIGVTPAGSRIMAKKMVMKLIKLDNVTAPQALVLKQELLARGGDVAIHKDAVTTENKKYDKNQSCILIGTEKQLFSLVEKLKGQQLELDKIGEIISEILEKSREDKYLHSN